MCYNPTRQLLLLTASLLLTRELRRGEAKSLAQVTQLER